MDGRRIERWKRGEELAPWFGRALRSIRVGAGLNTEALGRASGLSRYYIQRLEKGEGNPTLGTMEKLARALCQRPHQLIRDAQTYPDRRSIPVGDYWTSPKTMTLAEAFAYVAYGARIRARKGPMQMAVALTVSRTTVIRLEGGRANPSLKLIERLAREFDRRPEQLVHIAEKLQTGMDPERWLRSLGSDIWSIPDIFDRRQFVGRWHRRPP